MKREVIITWDERCPGDLTTKGQVNKLEAAKNCLNAGLTLMVQSGYSIKEAAKVLIDVLNDEIQHYS